eukprot:4506501-Amphidinium_carterae.1
MHCQREFSTIKEEGHRQQLCPPPAITGTPMFLHIIVPQLLKSSKRGLFDWMEGHGGRSTLWKANVRQPGDCAFEKVQCKLPFASFLASTDQSTKGHN